MKTKFTVITNALKDVGYPKGSEIVAQSLQDEVSPAGTLTFQDALDAGWITKEQTKCRSIN